MAKIETTQIGRTIRGQQLREMVPMADSTIYEMEQRGEFLGFEGCGRQDGTPPPKSTVTWIWGLVGKVYVLPAA